MARHRAPSPRSRTFTTMAATGAALSASLLTPATASAATAGHRTSTQQVTDPGFGHRDPHGRTRLHRARQHARQRASSRAGTPRPRAARQLRPMTSGERQYRNGCRQGYLTENCGEFTVSGLLGRGINPFD